jgi:acyl-coenzyme A thioesterase PaaI-like protein
MMNALGMFNRFKSLPLGTRLFSLGVAQAAPYFKTISPHVTELSPERVTVCMRKRRSVENHLHTVHAIAMCNMAELAGGLLTDVCVPQGARWIPSGMNVQYLAKAKTDLVATAESSGLDWSREGSIVVPVLVRDTEGTLVFRADIIMNVKHAKAAA